MLDVIQIDRYFPSAEAPSLCAIIKMTAARCFNKWTEQRGFYARNWRVNAFQRIEIIKTIGHQIYTCNRV